MQAYQPPVYWKPIGEVRARLSIPVVANGDIWTLDDFKRCQEQTGSEHFMLGRCALADPLLPLQVAQELGIPAPAPTFEGWKPILGRFAELSDQYSRKPGQQGYVVQRIKQWVRMSHQRKPLEWFDILKTQQNLQDLFEVIGRAYELPEHRIL
jgi:tRNA-dihydrouridine synthase C